MLPQPLEEVHRLNSVIPDLWPQDIAEVKTTPPLTILQEQARRLAEKTAALVCADVESVAERSNSFAHSFLLVAPTLGAYQTRLFRVKHGIHFYPLEILTDVDVPNFRCASLEDLVRALGEIFTSAPVKKIVQSLVAQAQALGAKKR